MQTSSVGSLPIQNMPGSTTGDHPALKSHQNRSLNSSYKQNSAFEGNYLSTRMSSPLTANTSRSQLSNSTRSQVTVHKDNSQILSTSFPPTMETNAGRIKCCRYAELWATNSDIIPAAQQLKLRMATLPVGRDPESTTR